MRAQARQTIRFSHVSLPAVVAGLMILAGCASTSGPDLLTISAAQYAAAFDLAVEAARCDGMPPALRDRRSGVIETEAQIAGSVLEPWRTDNASAAQAVENTVAFQRRRARFEFTPAGFQEPPRDLTKVPDDLELRVWVFVERASTPGLRRSTWTRSKTTTTQLVAPEGDTGPAPTTSWTPVTRDVAYERRLLAAVQDGLRSQGQ